MSINEIIEDFPELGVTKIKDYAADREHKIKIVS
jgi:uncharacterized protein (DUF433 family)